MDKVVLFLVNVVVGLLGGCASTLGPNYQDINFLSEPAGAACQIDRAGVALASITAPSVVRITRADAPLSVACKKDGYADVFQVVESGGNPDATMNWILGFGLISYAVDASTGAAYQYPDTIKVVLSKK